MWRENSTMRAPPHLPFPPTPSCLPLLPTNVSAPRPSPPCPPHLQLPLQPLAPHRAERLSALEEAEGTSRPTLHRCLDDVSDELS